MANDDDRVKLDTLSVYEKNTKLRILRRTSYEDGHSDIWYKFWQMSLIPLEIKPEILEEEFLQAKSEKYRQDLISNRIRQ